MESQKIAQVDSVILADLAGLLRPCAVQLGDKRTANFLLPHSLSTTRSW